MRPPVFPLSKSAQSTPDGLAIWGQSQARPAMSARPGQGVLPPAVRIATRQGKEIECLPVLASAAGSVVKRVRDLMEYCRTQGYRREEVIQIIEGLP